VAETAIARVLTVEDNPIVRAELRLVLEDAGFSVCADAKDGVEAVELARECDPDVILLELALPRIDGVEATRRIRSEHDVPIVALAAQPGGLVEAAKEAGATSCVVKPFEEEEVVGALLDALIAREDAAELGAREASFATLTRVLRLLGYPEEWAVELESRMYRLGKVWLESE